MKINVDVAKEKFVEYIKNNKNIYPIEIARILGIEEIQAIRLFRKYRSITNDNENNYVNADNFFKLYFSGKLSLKPPKNDLSPLKMH